MRTTMRSLNLRALLGLLPAAERIEHGPRNRVGCGIKPLKGRLVAGDTAVYPHHVHVVKAESICERKGFFGPVIKLLTIGRIDECTLYQM